MQLISNTVQQVTFSCLWENNTVMGSLVYASSFVKKRVMLWEELRHSIKPVPWFLVGDFNDLDGNHEKRGGRAVSKRCCDDFVKWFTSSSLIQIDAKNAQFTWSRGSGSHLVKEKLDKGFCIVSSLNLWNNVE